MGRRFGRFLQYTSGLEVDTDINDRITMLQSSRKYLRPQAVFVLSLHRPIY